MSRAADPFVTHVLELLERFGRARARRMFGGHGLYLDGLFVAIVAWDRLFLKADETSRGDWEAAGCAPFVYDAKGRPIRISYYEPPSEALDDSDLLRPWLMLAVDAAKRGAVAAPRRKGRRA